VENNEPGQGKRDDAQQEAKEPKQPAPKSKTDPSPEPSTKPKPKPKPGSKPAPKPNPKSNASAPQNPITMSSGEEESTTDNGVLHDGSGHSHSPAESNDQTLRRGLVDYFEVRERELRDK